MFRVILLPALTTPANKPREYNLFGKRSFKSRLHLLCYVANRTRYFNPRNLNVRLPKTHRPHLSKTPPPITSPRYPKRNIDATRFRSPELTLKKLTFQPHNVLFTGLVGLPLTTLLKTRFVAPNHHFRGESSQVRWNLGCAAFLGTIVFQDNRQIIVKRPIY